MVVRRATVLATASSSRGEGRQISAGGEAVADSVSAGAVDGVADRAEAVDVAADGADGHFGAFGEAGAGPFPPGLEQGQ
ncbi:hypothetical protein BIV25_29020 [Streptomyces sp. MUSC 14]|nr:hypothetical protein BIV25_29020 [Streptomyces sp. MUSC 14]